MATKAVAHYAISIRLACQVFKVSEGCYRYQPVLADENQEIADWLLRSPPTSATGVSDCASLYLRNVKGFGWEPQAGLPDLSGARAQSADKPKKRLVRAKPEPLAVPDQPESLLVDGLYA